MSGLDHIPLPIMGLCLLLGLSLIIELGYQLGKRIAAEPGMSNHPVEASVIRALLGLMAFMLAFTFGGAASRYVNSRNLAVTDANQIGSLHRMADYLPQANREKARSKVREYLQVRIDAINSQNTEDLQAGIQRSAEIQDELWAMAVTNRPDQDSVRTNPFVAALVDVIDTDATRQATALANRMPNAIWITLGLLAILATALLGMSSGLHGRRSSIVASVFILSYSAVFLLIVDLDRPFHSIFKLSDPAAERVLQRMDR